MWTLLGLLMTCPPAIASENDDDMGFNDLYEQDKKKKKKKKNKDVPRPPIEDLEEENDPPPPEEPDVPEDLDAPQDISEQPSQDLHWAFSIGLGASFLTGGNGKAYAPGVTEQFSFEYNITRYSQFYFGFNHTYHNMVDARPYFPDHGVSPGVLDGGQSFYSPEFGFRLGVKLSGTPQEGFQGWPFLRLGLGNAFTTTQIQLPSFEGTLDYLSYGYAPYFTVSGGAELRFRPNMSLLPELRTWWMGYEDGSEVSKASIWGLEGRIEPGMSFNLLW